MFSKKSAQLLQESTEECSYGATSNPGPAAEIKTHNEAKNSKLTSSAPAVLEPSKDATRPWKPPVQQSLEDSSSPPINPWRTLVTCSCPEPSVAVPISSDVPTIDDADVQTIDNADVQTIDNANVPEEVHATICSSFVNAYKNTAITLRNSLFIHVFQVLFSVIPISGIVMGALFDGQCEASELLPSYGGIVGFLGVIFTGLWIFINVRNRLGQSVSTMLKLICLCIFTFFSISVILDICGFGLMNCSFDEEAENYCSKIFYDYAFYKHIVTGATVIFALILYLPGCLHFINLHCF